MTKIGKVLVSLHVIPYVLPNAIACPFYLPMTCFLSSLPIVFLHLIASSFSAIASVLIPLPSHIPLPFCCPFCSRRPNIEVQTFLAQSTCLIITYTQDLLHNYTEVYPSHQYNLCFLRSALHSAGFVHVCVLGRVAMSLLLCFCTGCSILLSEAPFTLCLQNMSVLKSLS